MKSKQTKQAREATSRTRSTRLTPSTRAKVEKYITEAAKRAVRRGLRYRKVSRTALRDIENICVKVSLRLFKESLRRGRVVTQKQIVREFTCGLKKYLRPAGQEA